jgi:prepilin-type processing-associated H-X9-DG protein
LLPNHLHPINASESDVACFGSRHPGGANFVFADGSGRFLNNGINSQLFEALGTANGKEIVSLP